MVDEDRVLLKRDKRVFVDGVDSNYTWRKQRGQFEMLDEDKVHRVSHVDRKVFRLKVFDFHNGCGEFA